MSTLAHGVAQLVSGLVILGLGVMCTLVVLLCLTKILDDMGRYGSPFLAVLQLMLLSGMLMLCLIVLRLAKRLFFGDVPTSVRHYVHYNPQGA